MSDVEVPSKSKHHMHLLYTLYSKYVLYSKFLNIQQCLFNNLKYFFLKHLKNISHSLLTAPLESLQDIFPSKRKLKIIFGQNFL